MILSLILLLSIFHSTAHASSATSLEELVRNIWSNSLQIHAQEDQASIASNDRWRRFIINEPQLQYTNSDDNTAKSYGLSLTMPFPGKTFAFVHLDSAKSRAATAEIKAKKHELAKTFIQAYLDCASAQEISRLQQETTNDLQTVFKNLKILYETGHSTQAEKIGAELLSRQAKLDLVNAKDKQEVLCKKFNTILSGTGKISFIDTPALPDDIDSGLIEEMAPMTADQNRARAAIDIASATASTAWWSQLPDITFSMNRNHYIYLAGSPSGKSWTNTYGLSVTIPVLFPFHESVEARRAKSQAIIDQNSADLQKIAADSDQLDGAREYQRSKIRLKTLREKDLALGEALVDSTYSAYRAGKLGYAELVLSRKTLSDLRNQDIQLRNSIIGAHLRCLNHCDIQESFEGEE